MNLMTSVTIIILVVYSIIGYKRGLIKTVLSVGCILVALLASELVYGQVSKFIRDDTNIDTYIESKIAERVREQLFPKEEPDDGNTPVDAKKYEGHWNSARERTKVIEGIRLPEGLKKLLLDNKESDDVYKELGVTPITEFDKYIVKMLSNVIVNGIAFLVTFAILLIFCKVLLSMANILTDFPLVGWIDSLGGMALGFGKGLVLVWIVYFFVTMYSSTAWGMRAFYQIETSSWMKLINDNNILTHVLYNLTKTLF